MRKALRLAKRGAGYTSPNPMVGAVVVKDGEVIAQGYHRKFGDLHAEAQAIRRGGEKVRHSTMYVNLEPCSHFGKTPPCVDEIVKSGISKVVVSMIDPNPLVTGSGIEMLRRKGVEVQVGLLSSEAERLNEAYLKHTTKHEPFITMKAAITLDGMIADSHGNSKWISCEKSRRLVHRLRSGMDSVLVGIDTVLTDDPELTVRMVKSRRNPLRILLDTHLRVPLDAKILNASAPTLVVTATKGDKHDDLKQIGVSVWLVEQDRDGRIDLKSFLRRAGVEGITSILVEGGRGVYSAFLRQRLVDKFYVFIAPRLLGAGIHLSDQLNIRSIEDSLTLNTASLRKLDSDILITAYPK